MEIKKLVLDGQYKGLKNQVFDFCSSKGSIKALVGLNGSGKSQLLELIAEIFSYLERWSREDFTTNKGLGFAFKLYYSWDFNHDKDVLSYHDVLFKTNQSSDFRILGFPNGSIEFSHYVDGEWKLLDGERQIPLPVVVGYSSGLNENLQRPFMKNIVHYYDNQRVKGKLKKELLNSKLSPDDYEVTKDKYLELFPHIFKDRVSSDFKESDTALSKMIYLDYDNLSILLMCLAFKDRDKLNSVFGELKYNKLDSALIKFDFRVGTIDETSLRDIQLLIRIVGEQNFIPAGRVSTDKQYNLYGLNYLSGTIRLDFGDIGVIDRLKELNYNDPLQFFERMYKTQCLGIRTWGYEPRRNLKQDNFFGTEKKPLKSKLPLSVEQLILSDSDGNKVNISDLSDGETQLLASLSASLIFGITQSLFLFDEPETHLNPEWRTEYTKYLAKSLDNDQNSDDQPAELFISTHSPFMISSFKKENVLMFERSNNDVISMRPVDNETYGASFDVLIKELFNLRSLISQSVIDEIRKQLEKGDSEAYEWIKSNLGLSPERAYLLRKLKE